MFKWLKRNKNGTESRDGRIEKIEAIRKKNEAADVLMAAVRGERRERAISFKGKDRRAGM